MTLLPNVAIFAAYLIGAIPTGLLIGKWFRGIDLREHGSRNIGFTNAARVMGWKLGVPVLIIDVVKAWAAVFFLPRLLPGDPPSAYFPLIIALAVMLGNTLNVFLKFKGGKGIATGLGVFAAITPAPIGIALLVFLLTVGISRYVSLGSILAAASLPTATFFFYDGLSPEFFLTAVIGAFAIFKHRANIGRLKNGTESKIGSSRKKDAPSP